MSSVIAAASALSALSGSSSPPPQQTAPQRTAPPAPTTAKTDRNYVNGIERRQCICRNTRCPKIWSYWCESNPAATKPAVAVNQRSSLGDAPRDRRLAGYAVLPEYQLDDNTPHKKLINKRRIVSLHHLFERNADGLSWAMSTFAMRAVKVYVAYHHFPESFLRNDGKGLSADVVTKDVAMELGLTELDKIQIPGLPSSENGMYVAAPCRPWEDVERAFLLQGGSLLESYIPIERMANQLSKNPIAFAVEMNRLQTLNQLQTAALKSWGNAEFYFEQVESGIEENVDARGTTRTAAEQKRTAIEMSADPKRFAIEMDKLQTLNKLQTVMLKSRGRHNEELCFKQSGGPTRKEKSKQQQELKAVADAAEAARRDDERFEMEQKIESLEAELSQLKSKYAQETKALKDELATIADVESLQGKCLGVSLGMIDSSKLKDKATVKAGFKVVVGEAVMELHRALGEGGKWSFGVNVLGCILITKHTQGAEEAGPGQSRSVAWLLQHRLKQDEELSTERLSFHAVECYGETEMGPACKNCMERRKALYDKFRRAFDLRNNSLSSKTNTSAMINCPSLLMKKMEKQRVELNLATNRLWNLTNNGEVRGGPKGDWEVIDFKTSLENRERTPKKAKRAREAIDTSL